MKIIYAGMLRCRSFKQLNEGDDSFYVFIDSATIVKKLCCYAKLFPGADSKSGRVQLFFNWPCAVKAWILNLDTYLMIEVNAT